MPAFPYTSEQVAVIDAMTTGKRVLVTAGAGAGKSTTMVGVAEAMSGKGLYLVFNRAAKDDADKRMPRGRCDVKTTDALGRAYMVSRWGLQVWNDRMNAGRQTNWDAAKIVGIRGPHRISEGRVLAPQQVMRTVLATVERFCMSADEKIGWQHVVLPTGVVPGPEASALRQVVIPFAERTWKMVQEPHSPLKFSFAYAMKMWQQSGNVQIDGYDYLILDEAQDTNAAFGSVFARQKAQTAVIGDSNQQLYAWRGAVDAMATFQADIRLQMRQSFRFGPAVADVANEWLSVLDSDLRIIGFDKIESTVGPVEVGEGAVLCRTNAVAITELMEAQKAGHKVALAGGKKAAKPLMDMADAAKALKEGKSPWMYPDLAAFESWGALQNYVEEDHGGSDLKVFVKIVDDYGVDAVKAAASATVEEKDARVVVSTAHKSKGRQWSKVRIAGDFQEPRKQEDGSLGVIQPADAMLAYVAVTRAEHRLDNFGLAWVKRYLGGGTIPTVPVPTPVIKPAQNDTSTPSWLADLDIPLSALVGTDKK